MTKTRKCNRYCTHFSDVSIEFLCRYEQKTNVTYGADCFYELSEVSETQRAEADSILERRIKLQRTISGKRIKGPCNLRTVT